MILTDTGPIVALLDAREPHHARCVAALRTHRPPMLTTLPALSEAGFLLTRGRYLLPPLWAMLRRRDLIVHYLDDALLDRSVDLMEQYANVPMALADATLVALAERLHDDQIFTLDAHFRVYRTVTGQPFTLSP